MISPPPRVVVLGAGVAGLEAAFLLARRLSGRADVHVAYDDDTFLLRPNLVYVPFGADPSASTLHLSDTLARKGIHGDSGPIEGVDADAGRVHAGRGKQLPYEHLVIATGAAAWPQAVPGLHEHALCVGDPAAMSLLNERFLSIRGRAREGAPQRVLSHRWRAAKRVFSSYLLMQFAAGEPFQAGPGWRSMDLGVHGVHAMAGML